MPIKVIIPQGQTEITVNGLHQWDYGQTIEIHSADLPAMVEVHFACAGMTEAVVRSCTTVSGVATATIPDHCLEQTTPITAWVYEVKSGTSGYTSKTIILPIIPRTRPQVGATVPTTISDKYTESIAAINGIVSSLTEGKVKAKLAEKADSAGTINKYMHYIHLTGAYAAGEGNFAIDMKVSANLQIITKSASITPTELYNTLLTDYAKAEIQCTGGGYIDAENFLFRDYTITGVKVDPDSDQMNSEMVTSGKAILFVAHSYLPEHDMMLVIGDLAFDLSNLTLTDTVIKL